MRIYCDSNVFIIAVERSGPVADAIWRLIERAGALTRPVITSELALAEVLVKPLADHGGPAKFSTGTGPGTTASTYVDILTTTPGVKLIPVARDVLILAAHQRADAMAIKLPDAIHLATAESQDCTHFVTADRQLLRTRQFKGIGLDAAALDALAEAFK